MLGLGLGLLGKGIKAASGYAAERSKERSTALGGGLCIAALYFHAEKPNVVNETMFYIVFAVGAGIALLKTQFMMTMATMALEAVKRRVLPKKSKPKSRDRDLKTKKTK